MQPIAKRKWGVLVQILRISRFNTEYWTEHGSLLTAQGSCVATQSHTQEARPSGMNMCFGKFRASYLSWALWRLFLWEATLHYQYNAASCATGDSGHQESCAMCENLGWEIGRVNLAANISSLLVGMSLTMLIKCLAQRSEPRVK